MLKPVKRAHRRVSRRQLGSSNRRKATHMLARLYERINNKRRDFLHKTSTCYASRYDLIFQGKLRIMNMTKNHRLARRILDSSWSTYIQGDVLLQGQQGSRSGASILLCQVLKVRP
jgi:putative transposase